MTTTNAFISYSHADERLLERLHKHLAMLQRENLLSSWTDHALLPGTAFDAEIMTSLENSDLFIALISPDYIASNYCYEKEFKRAQELASSGKLRIVPIILEPCDWASTPFRTLMALPKDGKPVSSWTNENTAFLDIVTGLRRLLRANPIEEQSTSEAVMPANPSVGRRPRLKQDFDTIQKSEYIDKAYETMKEYFRLSCVELNNVTDTIKAKFDMMDSTAFTCTVVNRAKRTNGDASITVRNMKRNGFMGDISYIYLPHAQPGSSHGAFNVMHDDYKLFLVMNAMSMMTSREIPQITPEQAAEELWNNFVQRAGIEYE